MITLTPELEAQITAIVNAHRRWVAAIEMGMGSKLLRDLADLASQQALDEIKAAIEEIWRLKPDTENLLRAACEWMMDELCRAWDEPPEQAIPSQFLAAFDKERR